MLISSIGCGHATRLTYAVQARPEQVFHRPQSAVSSDTAGAWSRAQRVVLDLSPKCNAPAEVLRARCEHVEAALSEAIRRTGREVIVSKQSQQSALALARDHQAAIVLTVELPAYRWKSGADQAFYLKDQPDKGLAGAHLRCSAEVRSQLAGQATHLKASLNAQIQTTEAPALLWDYRDALEGQAELDKREIEASYEGREEDTSSSSDDGVAYHHHHHDHSCRHHHGHARDRDGDDDDGAALLAAIVLTVLVVGIVILVASAAQSEGAKCTLLSLPEPDIEDKQRLAERLDRLLSERLVAALQSSGTAAPAP